MVEAWELLFFSSPKRVRSSSAIRAGSHKNLPEPNQIREDRNLRLSQTVDAWRRHGVPSNRHHDELDGFIPPTVLA
ncbi:hypothetical protein ElyMa_001906200 [Elysia marginata]|uniref:Uncharacterized protein n=1 Tax=Elysia marginata TaxID=1093978 RepID=A0AAV4EUK0_9GAST|nr:hypothetical protein ElyMa_001906200 [Elysia marginata]